MNAKLKIALNIVVWCAILAYSVFAIKYCSQKQDSITCKGARIEVKDSASLGFITPTIVRNMLVNGGIKITGVPLSEVDIVKVEKEIASKGYVKNCKVYTSMDGYVNIEVEQRRPKLQIRSENGYNIYITEDNFVLPIVNYFFVDVPIITGVLELPFNKDFIGALPQEKGIEKKYAENYKFLFNLINFVGFLEKDTFWKSQIVQINIVKGTQIELIPRVGDYVICVGGMDDYEKKLDKLLTFYKKGLEYEGWHKYKDINIEYEGQIVCTE